MNYAEQFNEAVEEVNRTKVAFTIVGAVVFGIILDNFTDAPQGAMAILCPFIYLASLALSFARVDKEAKEMKVAEVEEYKATAKKAIAYAKACKSKMEALQVDEEKMQKLSEELQLKNKQLANASAQVASARQALIKCEKDYSECKQDFEQYRASAEQEIATAQERANHLQALADKAKRLPTLTRLAEAYKEAQEEYKVHDSIVRNTSTTTKEERAEASAKRKQVVGQMQQALDKLIGELV